MTIDCQGEDHSDSSFRKDRSPTGICEQHRRDGKQQEKGSAERQEKVKEDSEWQKEQ